MSTPSPVTDGTLRVGDDRHRHPQGVRLQRHRDLGARHPEGLRPLRSATGATGRRRCCTAMRSTCRCCTACAPTIRRTCCASTRRPARRVWRVERPTAARFGVARRLHHAGAAALRQHDRDRRHRRRRRDRPRSGDRKGAVARQRPQSRQRRQLPHRRVAGGSRRHDLRAVARAAAARAESRRPRRRHEIARRSGRSTTDRTCRRRSPTAPTSTSSTTAGIMFCLDAKTGKEIYGRQRLAPGTYSGSPVLADGKIYVTNEDGVTSVDQGGTGVRAARGERLRRLHAQLAGGVRWDRSSSARRSSSTRSARSRLKR